MAAKGKRSSGDWGAHIKYRQAPALSKFLLVKLML